MSRPHLRRLVARLVLAVGAAVLALVGVEGFFRVRHLDRPLVNRNLHYQFSDLAAYRVSEDPLILYETRPGARLEGEGPYGPFTVSIDPFGARGPAHPEQAPPQTTRIFFFGASTVFGANVSDHETLPAALESALNARRPPAPVPPETDRRFEVWNFACSGYVLPQLLGRARETLSRLSGVDLLILMNTNSGRRLFLGGDDALERDNLPWFRADPSLWLENFPPSPSTPEAPYTWALNHSAVARAVVGRRWSQRQRPGGANPYVHEVSRQAWRMLRKEASAAGVPIVFAFYPRRQGGATPYLPIEIPEARRIDLQARSTDPDFYEIHPPPRILAAHAERLATALQQTGWLSP